MRTTILTITLTSCIWSSSAAAKALHLVIFSLPSSANWITLCNWSWLALLTGMMWISYDRISDSNWCLDSSQMMATKIWVVAFSGNPRPWVHCIAIFTDVRALSLCLTILPGILRGKIYRLLSHVACTWAGLRGVSHPSSTAFPRLLTQCSAFKWPLIGCDCSAFHPSEYFCNK